jgi:hypothetical protein
MTDDTLTLNTPTTHSHSLELRARLSHKPPGAGSAAVHPARFSAATVVLQRPAHKESSPAHVRRVRAPLLPGGSWIAAGTYTSRVRIHSLTCVSLSRLWPLQQGRRPPQVTAQPRRPARRWHSATTLPAAPRQRPRLPAPASTGTSESNR